MIPWLAGDYNPWESCDTLHVGQQEVITADCHQSICPSLDSTFYQNQPSGQRRCYDKNAQQVSFLNVPGAYDTNLCSKYPEDVRTCGSGKHGMLLGLQGSWQEDLYRDSPVLFMNEVVAKAGAGLFLQGGNPLYYTAKGTSEDLAKQVHAVLWGHQVLFHFFLIHAFHLLDNKCVSRTTLQATTW